MSRNDDNSAAFAFYEKEDAARKAARVKLNNDQMNARKSRPTVPANVIPPVIAKKKGKNVKRHLEFWKRSRILMKT